MVTVIARTTTAIVASFIKIVLHLLICGWQETRISQYVNLFAGAVRIFRKQKNGSLIIGMMELWEDISTNDEYLYARNVESCEL